MCLMERHASSDIAAPYQDIGTVSRPDCKRGKNGLIKPLQCLRSPGGLTFTQAVGPG